MIPYMSSVTRTKHVSYGYYGHRFVWGAQSYDQEFKIGYLMLMIQEAIVLYIRAVYRWVLFERCGHPLNRNTNRFQQP